MAAPFHLVDTATGEVVRELGRGWATKPTRPRRRSKRARSLVMHDFTMAAVFVLGVCPAVVVGVRLSYVVMP
ncbi:hypothetical protein [Streptomyces sp. NBC_01373]|uniref:hypothetical protein n=1 Tax=Streptomyces sp. NBC_01373 TaxID=2903843 RepID=UPI00225A7E53|nr:hypothetical protein [Streptomyces sp. NBC_01373]MCX4699005.1 hypothetical protein [Streptomyces sp. NBC_01373]